MKIFILTSLTLSMLFYSCSNNSKPIAETSTDEETVTSSTDKPEKEIPENQKAAITKTDTPDLKKIRELTDFKGTIEEHIQWTDSLGQHIVITSKKDIYWTDSEYNQHDLQNAELSCFHYLQKTQNGPYEQVWKIQDHVKDCPVDAVANFQKGVLQQTDLNGNGVPEIWVMYYTACKGDVSPSLLKLIMYEGNRKYKMTGETRKNIGNGDYAGGGISSEGNFRDELLFLEFAKKLWKKNSNEDFGG